MKEVKFGSISSLQQIIEQDVDVKFLEQVGNDKLEKHCINAMCMSHCKYGNVNDYVARKAPKNFDIALAAYEEDGNAEHLVDCVNYLMIRQMFYKDEEHRCLVQAKEIAKRYREEDYKPTDSSGSTNIRVQNMTTTSWIRQHMGLFEDSSAWRW